MTSVSIGLAMVLPISLKSVDSVVIPPASTSFSGVSLYEIIPKLTPGDKFLYGRLFDKLYHIFVLHNNKKFTFPNRPSGSFYDLVMLNVSFLAGSFQPVIPLFGFFGL